MPCTCKKNKITTEGGGEGGASGRTTAEPRGGEGRPGRVKGGRPPGAPGATRGWGLGANVQLFYTMSWTVEVGQSGQKCKMDREGSASALRAFTAVCVVGQWAHWTEDTPISIHATDAIRARSLDTYS